MFRSKKLFAVAMAIVLVASVVVGFSARSTVQAQDKLSGKLEIFSWWAGDEGPALEALLKLYNTKYPDVKVTNATVTGGAGVAAKAVLKTRMLGGNPPDAFQVHAGQELTGTWVVANKMDPVTEVIKADMDKFPKGLIDLISYKGEVYSIPVNIHRSNVMWYVPDNLTKWGVQVPKTWDEFFKTCDALKAKNVTALALGENWTQVHLFENVLLGTLGPDGYRDLFAGKLKWTDDKVKAAWANFDKVLACTNADAGSLSWQQASDLVLAGKAAFNVMGDWAAGYFTTTKKLEPGKGFGWAPAPGTGGSYIMLSDSFGLPKGAPNKANALAWLKLLASVEGQNTFNPLKGSIPARLDAGVKDSDKYNAYLKSAAADWTDPKTQVVGSLMHGAAAPEAFLNDFQTVIGVFAGTHNVDLAAAASQALAEASPSK